MPEKQAVFFPTFIIAVPGTPVNPALTDCGGRPVFIPALFGCREAEVPPMPPLEIAHRLVYTAKLESSYSIQNTNLKNKQTSHSPKLVVFCLKIRTCEDENTNLKGKKK